MSAKGLLYAHGIANFLILSLVIFISVFVLAEMKHMRLDSEQYVELTSRYITVNVADSTFCS